MPDKDPNKKQKKVYKRSAKVTNWAQRQREQVGVQEEPIYVSSLANENGWMPEVRITAYKNDFVNTKSPGIGTAAKLVGKFLGLPTLPKSNYKPTKSVDSESVYYTTPKLKEHVVNNLYNRGRMPDDEALNTTSFNELYDNIKLKQSKEGYHRMMNGLGLGGYTVDVGEDEKGKYISVYDRYDFGLLPFAKGYEIYDRIYENDLDEIYYNRNKKSNGGGTGKPPKKKNPDLTPLDLATMYENNASFGGNRYLDTNLLRAVDNQLIRRGMPLAQRMAVASTAHQEGSRLTSHGNGAFGLFGFRGARAENLPSTAEGQADKIYDETFGVFNPDNWNHGGKGSGYNTAKEAQQAFTNATTPEEAMRALTYGYVRPPQEDRKKRVTNVTPLFTKRKQK